MGFFHEYPYTDFHEMNLDWILHQIMKLHKEYDEFKAINEITNAGTWDIAKQYKAWTIVSDNNIGYISVKPVPAGIPITDTEYWSMIADYDIVISDLSDRIDALEHDMGDAQQDIADIQDELNHLGERKFILIGDSYAGTFGSLAYGWMSAFATKLGLVKDTDVFFYQAAGAGFVGAAPLTFGDLAQQAINDIVTIANEITDIVIAGGANDASASLVDIDNAKSAVQNALHAAFPNAHIAFSVIGIQTTAATTTENILNIARFDYEFPSRVGWMYPIVNGWVTMYNTYFHTGNGDFVHPTEIGARNIGITLASAVATRSIYGEAPAVDEQTIPITGGISGFTSNIKIHHTNTGIKIYQKTMSGFYLNFTTDGDAGYTINLGKYNNGDYGIVASTQLFPITVTGQLNGQNKWRLLPAWLEFADGDTRDSVKVNLRIRSDQEATTYQALRIMPFSIFINF